MGLILGLSSGWKSIILNLMECSTMVEHKRWEM